MGMSNDAKNVFSDLKRWYHMFKIDTALNKMKNGIKNGINNQRNNGKIKGNVDEKMKKLNAWIRNEMKK